jgi:hypothetical protein
MITSSTIPYPLTVGVGILGFLVSITKNGMLSESLDFAWQQAVSFDKIDLPFHRRYSPGNIIKLISGTCFIIN